VSRQDGTGKLQRVEDSKHVVTEPIRIITSSGNAGRAEPTSGDSIHMVVSGEFWREIIVNVSRISERSQENQGPAGATPIEHLQTNIIIHGYELDLVRRRVAPVGCFLRAERHEKPNDRENNGAWHCAEDHRVFPPVEFDTIDPEKVPESSTLINRSRRLDDKSANRRSGVFSLPDVSHYRKPPELASELESGA
jgi:hypothetical protein